MRPAASALFHKAREWLQRPAQGSSCVGRFFMEGLLRRRCCGNGVAKTVLRRTSSASYRSMLVQKRDNLCEALWKASFEDRGFGTRRQADFEASRVEHESCLGEDGVFLRVDGVAENGTAHVGAVNAELVSSAGLGVEGEKRIGLRPTTGAGTMWCVCDMAGRNFVHICG